MAQFSAESTIELTTFMALLRQLFRYKQLFRRIHFSFFFYSNLSLHIEFEGGVKNIMLGYFSLFFIFLSLSFIQTQVYTLSLMGDVKNIMLGYLLLLYVY
jgi:hypothetical protein